MNGTLNRAARRAARTGIDLFSRSLSVVGFTESSEKLIHDAQSYWRSAEGDRWRGHSHWRDAEVFADGDLWSEVGKRHLELYERLARVREHPPEMNTVLEWGCGGGANAVSFAPLAKNFVGVEISGPSLDECARQVAAECSTPFTPVLIDGDHPEDAVGMVEGKCDVFLCFYVFELITSQEYGLRLLRIARQMLTDDGLALIQVKYDTGSFRTRSRRRGYGRGLADMTTYRIDTFWQLARACGLTPEVVHLVPQNELDERYAYFLLSVTPT
jgi:hypothetical protein